MGFWDIFKPIARIGSDILTGGAAEGFWQPESMIEGAARGGGGGGDRPTGNVMTDVSQVLGKTAGNAAAGRLAEGNYLNNRDAIKARLYEAQQNAAKTALGLPNQGATEAVRGSLLKNLQDQGVEIPAGSQLAGHVLNFTGGMRPSDLTPEARQAGVDLITHGQKLIADPNSFLPKSPEMSAEPDESTWAKLAGIGATGAGLLGALSPVFKKQGGNDNSARYEYPDEGPATPVGLSTSVYDPSKAYNPDDEDQYGQNFWTGRG